ncbi:MAG: hypothetical protein ACKVZH_04655 [Blastocatellia bacterium]
MRRTLALSGMADREVENKVCSMCGAIAGDVWETKSTRQVQLRLRPRQGDATHLWIICDECNEGLQNTALPKPDRIHLLAQIRRATIPDQQAVLDWLLQKFNLKAEKGRRD